MRGVKADLLKNVVTSYDQTKTTIMGRVKRKTILGGEVLGPPVSRFIDFFTDTGGLTPLGSLFLSQNGRLFVITALATGVGTLCLYDFDSDTGTSVFVGKINFAIPNVAATTHTLRGLRVLDTGTTGWKVIVATTGAVLINGGVFIINNVDKADFVQVSPPTFPFASGDNQKAVYFSQNPIATYTTSVTVTVAGPGKVQFASHPFKVNDAVQFAFGTLPTGLALNTTYFVRNPTTNDFELSLTRGGVSITTTGSPGTAQIGSSQQETAIAGLILDATTSKLYSHNGVAATHQYYVRSLLAAMTYASASSNITVATPGKVQYANHPFCNNDPVVFLSGTVPTGLALNTPYFVRNATANDFELSLTTAGASINTTGLAGTAVIGRAFGITGASWLHKTNDLPALTGVLLLLDSEAKATPANAPINGPLLNGNACAFFATSTNLYLGLLSELTENAFTWPSLTTANVLGAVNQITVPAPTFAGWMDSLDCAYFITNTSKVIFKRVENNVILSMFGELNNQYYETAILDTISLGLVTVINAANQFGWLLIAGGTIGQRGIVCVDARSDAEQDHSYIVTKVLDTVNSRLVTITSIEKLFEETGNIKVQYRTSGFDSISGGWTDIELGADLNAIALDLQIQFKILFRIQSEGSSCPAQLSEFIAEVQSNTETSDNWEYSHTNSSAISPTRVAFRLKRVYVGSVPKLLFRSYDLADTLLISQNTEDNAENFEYSANNGNTWLPLGTIPNVVGTLIRYNFTSPPGVDIRPGIQEA